MSAAGGVKERTECETAESSRCSEERARAECFRCGLRTCRACSSMRILPRYGRQRVCDNCMQYEPNGEAWVLRRRHHEAGYKHVTLRMCRDWLERRIDRIPLRSAS